MGQVNSNIIRKVTENTKHGKSEFPYHGKSMGK